MPRILLVEDNEANGDLLSRRLQHQGHLVITAPNGPLGYSVACSESPDLILMDISLPEMDGWKVINLLKAKQATCHIPIIVVTAHALVTDRIRAFEAGCDDYDTKPIDFDRLAEKIDRLLGKLA